MTATRSGPVLCGVDFSEPSRRALHVAIVLARQLNVPLTVITVVHPLLAHAAEVQFGADRFTSDTTRDLETFVADSVPAGATWMPATEYVVTVGDAAPSILSTAADRHPSIIVVGTRGLGRAQRLLFGSTTARILRSATQPVLAVPDRDQVAVEMTSARARLKVDRLLCAIDLDEPSFHAARTALELGRRLEVPVTLMHAVLDVAGPEGWAPLLESTSRESTAQAEAKLAEWVAQLGEAANVIIKSGTPADVLIAEVASGPPAWLVIGLGAPGRAPGSTATQVVAESHAPVLAVPAV